MFCEFLVDYLIQVGLSDFPLRTDFESGDFAGLAPTPNSLGRNAEKLGQFLYIKYFVFFAIHWVSLWLVVLPPF
jgi:hypothetical protein